LVPAYLLTCRCSMIERSVGSSPEIPIANYNAHR
jgi:hypothetical protein